MNTCIRNRKQLALLALHALASQDEQALRVHLDHCAECRGYLEEISVVAEKLRAARPASEGQPSESFHRNLMAALAGTKHKSFGELLFERMGDFWSWRLALPTGAAVVVVAWLIAAPHTHILTHQTPVVQPVAMAPLKDEMEPTLSNYEMAVHQSVDKLDELLNKQDSRIQESSPIYTASRFPGPTWPNKAATAQFEIDGQRATGGIMLYSDGYEFG